eukprot:scaffold6997_cov54-Phaeocystis_antarctica.AAC.3
MRLHLVAAVGAVSGLLHTPPANFLQIWARIRQIYERNLGGFQSKLWPGPSQELHAVTAARPTAAGGRGGQRRGRCARAHRRASSSLPPSLRDDAIRPDSRSSRQAPGSKTAANWPYSTTAQAQGGLQPRPASDN